MVKKWNKVVQIDFLKDMAIIGEIITSFILRFRPFIGN